MKMAVTLMIGIILGRLLKLLEEKITTNSLHIDVWETEKSWFERWLLNQHKTEAKTPSSTA